MSRSVAVPEDLYNEAAKAAATDHVTLEEFVSAALAEQLAARRYIEARAKRASEERFRQALDAIPDVEAEDRDKV